MASLLKKRFKKAKEKLEKFLKKHEVELGKCIVVVNRELNRECMIKIGYPNCVLVNRKNIAESTLAYQLVNVAQNKLITPINIKYLYSLLAEGLSDYVVDKLYSNYTVINPLGYNLIELLKSDEDDEDIIMDLFKLGSIKVRDKQVDKLIQSEKVNLYFKRMLRPRLDMVKRALQVTDELDLDRSNYLPFGEELKAWVYITKPKFNPKWGRINKILAEYYEE